MRKIRHRAGSRMPGAMSTIVLFMARIIALPDQVRSLQQIPLTMDL